VPFTQVAESCMHSMPVVSTRWENEKSIGALKKVCISVSRFSLSLLSATKVEITKARQDSTAVYGNAIKSICQKAVCHFLCVCAFRLFSNDKKVAMKILLFSKSERCSYSFHRYLLFQMTYLMQRGQWFVANCHVFS